MMGTMDTTPRIRYRKVAGGWLVGPRSVDGPVVMYEFSAPGVCVSYIGRDVPMEARILVRGELELIQLLHAETHEVLESRVIRR